MYFLYSLLNLKTKFIGDLSLGTILIIGFHQTMILEIREKLNYDSGIISSLVITLIIVLLNYWFICLFLKYCPVLLGKAK